MKHRALTLAAAAAFAFNASPARSETSNVSATGFVVTHRFETTVSAHDVFDALHKPVLWWSNDHTWSGDARNLRPLLGRLPSVESAHPSPMSADRGFFGSRPFSRANALLAEMGAEPIDWRLP